MSTPQEKRRRRLERQRRLEEAEESAFRGVTPSRSYHQYFEDYSESVVLGQGGKKKIVRVYVGKYYLRDCSDAAWAAMKAVCVLLFLAAAASMLLAMLFRSPCNEVWYTIVPGFLTLLAAVLLGVNLFSCVFSRRRMKKYTYSLHGKLPRQCVRCIVPAAVYLIAVAVCAALTGLPRGLVLPPVLLALLSLALFALLAVLEHRAKYRAEDGGKKPDPNSVIIS